MKQIYLDYAATTPVDPEVFKAMKPYFSAKFGNPSSLHFFGQEAMAAIDESREKIAKAIGAPPAGGFREIIFTGSATEANNLVLRGMVKNFYLLSKNQKQIALKNIPQARQAWFPRSGIAAPRAKKIRPLEADYSGSEKQFVFDNNKNFTQPRIIVSAIEHESILETCRDLEKACPELAEGNEIEIIYLPVNRQGFIDLKKLKESLNERVILVSIMYANNEIGTVQPIAEIAEIVRNFRNSKLQAPNSKKITNSNDQNSKKWDLGFGIWDLPAAYPLVHTDAVQAFQFLNCDINKLGVDLMTLSAHKIYGPKGIGALYIANRVQPIAISEKKSTLNPKPHTLNPIITGGGQEFGLRSGTENVPEIVGFAKAVELAVKNREKETKRIAGLANYFWKEIKKIYPAAQLNNNSILKQTALKNILNIYFPNPVRNNISNGASQNSQDLLMKLDLAGIAVSSGSACSTRSTQPSHVLKAIGLNEKKIKSSLRFSFGKFTTQKEIKETIKIMQKILNSQ